MEMIAIHRESFDFTVGALEEKPQTLYRGVNLGGFLVLESWIIPSLFANNSVPDGLGEWQFCETVGPTNAPAVCMAFGAVSSPTR